MPTEVGIEKDQDRKKHMLLMRAMDEIDRHIGSRISLLGTSTEGQIVLLPRM